MVPKVCSWLEKPGKEWHRLSYVRSTTSRTLSVSRKALGPMVALAALLASKKPAMQILSWQIKESPTQFGWCYFLCFVLLKGCSLSHVCLKKAPITHFLCGFVFGGDFYRFFYGKVQKSIAAKSPFGFSNREISSTQKTAWMKKHLYAEKIDSWMSQKGWCFIDGLGLTTKGRKAWKMRISGSRNLCFLTGCSDFWQILMEE